MTRSSLFALFAVVACGGSNAPSFYAVPLTSPDGSFWSPTLHIGGQSFVMDLDTGSTVTGIAGTSCTTCTGMSPLYTPGAGATTMNKADSASYADGSGWSGKIFNDMVGLGHGSPDVALGFVNISSQSMFFSGNEYQGILGLGARSVIGHRHTIDAAIGQRLAHISLGIA